MLWVRISIRARCRTLYDKVSQWLATRSVVFSGFLHQYNWPPRHNWNSIESCVKHHQINNEHEHDENKLPTGYDVGTGMISFSNLELRSWISYKNMSSFDLIVIMFNLIECRSNKKCYSQHSICSSTTGVHSANTRRFRCSFSYHQCWGPKHPRSSEWE